jgi:hypothetical protein
MKIMRKVSNSQMDAGHFENNREIMEKEIQLEKLVRRERLYRGFGITLVVVGGLLFLRFLFLYLESTKLPVPREVVLFIAIFIFLIPFTGVGVFLLFRGRRLKREIGEIYDSMGAHPSP